MYASTSGASKNSIIRAITFEKPDIIPMTFHINEASFDHYPLDDLFELIDRHPLLFPDFKKKKPTEYAINARKDKPYTDDFGCTWFTSMNGIVGSVLKHPLNSWDKYSSYAFPDPETSNGLGYIDWKFYEKECEERRSADLEVYGDLRHGHTFLQLCDIRGFENIIYDMMDEEPLLDDLIERITEFNLAQIKHFIAYKVDIIRIPEDLGMQVGPMLSPDNFLRYIKPAYQKLMKFVRNNGILLHMHSDGDIRLLVDDIIEGGIDAINLQDLVNGVDWISHKFKGRVCVDLDIDRQKITPFGTPKEIDELIRNEVAGISCKEGGLMMVYGLYPGIPIENVKAVMDAMERYMNFHN